MPKDVPAAGPGLRDQAQGAEQRVDDQRRDHNGHQHQGGDPQRVRGPVVLAVGQDDREHDEVGEQECHHAAERDAARPQHRGERNVPDRAHEGECRDERPDDRVLDDAQRRPGVRDEQSVEEPHRAHEAQDGHDRAEDHVLDRPQRVVGIADEQRVEEVVAQLSDEPGQDEADRDLLPQHPPVVAEVVGYVRPCVE